MNGIFDKAFARVFSHEGGFQKDPMDRGNWTSGRIGEGELKGTKFGLAAMTYPRLDIANLKLSEAKEIYRRDWWVQLGMDRFPAALGYQIFDAAINHGMYNTTKMLQRAVGERPDGVIGPKTRAAAGNAEVSDLLMRFLAERLLFMTDIVSWNHYGRGWARRVAENLKLAADDS